jgi:hypothetical protein
MNKLTTDGKRLIKKYYTKIKKDAENKRNKLLVDLQEEINQNRM